MNSNLCEARKSMKGDGYFKQCTHRKKNDSIYCGKHQNCSDPFSNYLKSQIPKTILIETPKPIEIHTVINSEKQTFHKEKYQNDTDFFNLESIEAIPLEYFYEYQEKNHYFAFDIRSLYDYLKSCNPFNEIKNPYTHVVIPKDRIQEIYKYYENLKVPKVDYKDDLSEILQGDKAIEWKCLDIFQKINELGHYTDHKWFWNLNSAQLKHFYRELEDLWNYRIYLTPVQKQKILPNYTPFIKYSVHMIIHMNDLTNIRNIILDEIHKFITMGLNEGKNGNDNRYTGSILVLTALVETSTDAAQGLPHLVPIVD